MNLSGVDVTACEREPIHIPGSIQPHGVLLVADAHTLMVTHGAGDIEGRLGFADWIGLPLSRLLGDSVARAIELRSKAPLRLITPPLGSEFFDITVSEAGTSLIVELEPAGGLATAAVLLPELEAAAQAFEQAADMDALLATAAREFRKLTAYDRVMVYRFLDDEAGKVVAEDSAENQHSFMNHHFPASDIPAQARALYVRNLVRVIPDVEYSPAPLRPQTREPLDMSDGVLRSVSPVHIEYLRNMGVAASASVSIVKDGVLWGLIACHSATPRNIPADVRAASRALAGSLSRQIRAREDTDTYRERVRLRTFEDRIVELLLREGSLDAAVSKHLGEIQRMLGGDGVAVIRGGEVVSGGRCPESADMLALSEWIATNVRQPVFATNNSADLPLPDSARPLAAGILSITLSSSEPWIVVWFRAEQIEIVKWAGNPHKALTVSASGTLNPRASFDAWTETVRGRARRWTIAEIEAAGRLAIAVTNVWQTRRIRDLNKELISVVDQKEALVQQREFLLGEVNHRVQNSLQLVSSFLALQARETDDVAAQSAIEEARRRIAAVSLVHRRLYSSEQIKTIDASRYVDELLDELLASLGGEWAEQMTRDLEPVLLPNDRAITVGLVLTELVINANKYAYGGGAGPIRISLSENRNTLRLTVADKGKGRDGVRKGFGSRMLDALVQQLGGTLNYEDTSPGTRATLSAPIEGNEGGH